MPIGRNKTNEKEVGEKMGVSYTFHPIVNESIEQSKIDDIIDASVSNDVKRKRILSKLERKGFKIDKVNGIAIESTHHSGDEIRLPFTLFPEITFIKIHAKNIGKFSITKFPHLQKIQIAGVRKPTFPDEAYPNIESIDIDHLGEVKIPYAEKLQTLNVQNGQIFSHAAGTKPYPLLKKCDLSRFEFIDLPRMPNLEDLNINSMYGKTTLTGLDQEFLALKKASIQGITTHRIPLHAPNLERLEVSFSSSVKDDPLFDHDFPTISRLDLRHDDAQNADFLHRFLASKEIHLETESLTNISKITLPNLTALTIRGKFTDLSALTAPNLEKIELKSSEFDNMKNLPPNLPNLKKLIFSYPSKTFETMEGLPPIPPKCEIKASVHSIRGLPYSNFLTSELYISGSNYATEIYGTCQKEITRAKSSELKDISHCRDAYKYLSKNINSAVSDIINSKLSFADRTESFAYLLNEMKLSDRANVLSRIDVVEDSTDPIQREQTETFRTIIEDRFNFIPAER